MVMEGVRIKMTKEMMKQRSDPPVVMAVFGTTRNRRAYDELLEDAKKAFPNSEISISYSSRMVRDMEEGLRGRSPKSPFQALMGLAAKGYKWAVVQSVHLIAGHEFHRLVEGVHAGKLRVSMGLPLLWSYEDYLEVSRVLSETYRVRADEALVFIGHGTDHASWSSYLCLEGILRRIGVENSWVGLVEGKPNAEQVARDVKEAGFERARLIPLMLVAGVHVMEDIGSGQDGAWAKVFREFNMEIRVEERGLLELSGIRRLFFKHVTDAMDLVF